jgi:hypothetical protein
MNCAKQSYRSKNQALLGAKKSGFKKDRAYLCPDCNFWHITRSVPVPIKRSTLPKTAEPKPWIPSLAKLRRKLENASRLITAQTRQLDAAQAVLAAAQKVHDEEIACIAALYAHQHSAN